METPGAPALLVTIALIQAFNTWVKKIFSI